MDCELTIFVPLFILREQNITQKQLHVMIYSHHNLNVVIRIRNESLWQIKICRDLGFTYHYPNPDDMLEKRSDF